jgi:hypothetical protein
MRVTASYALDVPTSPSPAESGRHVVERFCFLLSPLVAIKFVSSIIIRSSPCSITSLFPARVFSIPHSPPCSKDSSQSDTACTDLLRSRDHNGKTIATCCSALTNGEQGASNCSCCLSVCLDEGQPRGNQEWTTGSESSGLTSCYPPWKETERIQDPNTDCRRPREQRGADSE